MLGLGKERVKQLKADGFAEAGLYDPPGVGGTGVVTVLKYADKPELYGLPRDPTVPKSVRFVKSYLRPLGLLGLGAVVVGPRRSLPPLRSPRASQGSASATPPAV